MGGSVTLDIIDVLLCRWPRDLHHPNAQVDQPGGMDAPVAFAVPESVQGPRAFQQPPVKIGTTSA
jgi:hypothetical protein